LNYIFHLNRYYPHFIGLHSQYLLGDWLLFWRVLKQQHGSLIDLARKGYDLNIYANIICTEICHHHLQNTVTPLYLPWNHGPLIDLHEILQAIYDIGQEELGMEDNTFWLLLDTLAYVFTGIDEEPTELLGLPWTWSQPPSLMRKETVLLLVQLLGRNKMKYNLSSKKLLLCLQMLQPVPIMAPSRKIFYSHYQKYNPSKEELLEQMSMTLEGLLKVFIPQLSPQTQDYQEDVDIQNNIAYLILRQLFHSILAAETPPLYDDSIILHLPPAYIDDLLDYILDQTHWTGHLQLCWLCDLLIKLHDKGYLPVNKIERCVGMLTDTLISDWAESKLQHLLQKTMDFFNILWKMPPSRNLVCIALYDIVHQSFIKGIKGRNTVAHFIEKQALDTIKLFLESEGCSEDCRSKWQDIPDWGRHWNL